MTCRDVLSRIVTEADAEADVEGVVKGLEGVGNAFAFRPTTPFSEKKFFFFRYKVLEGR